MQSSRVRTTIKQLQLREQENDLDEFERGDLKEKQATEIINDLFDFIHGNTEGS